MLYKKYIYHKNKKNCITKITYHKIYANMYYKKHTENYDKNYHKNYTK